MPGFDRTGPMGYGPRTGRATGPCGRGIGFRSGFGRGMGRGFGRGYWGYGPGYGPAGHVPVQAPTNDQEIADLRAEKEAIETELRDIEARLGELEKREEKK